MATTQKFELRPTSGSPEFVDRVDYDEVCGEPASFDPESVGWDLSFGSRLNFGPDEHGTLTVTLNLSDDALARGIVHRAVTRDQIIGFARHLLALAKGPDDIETLAASLAETAAKFDKRILEQAEKIAAGRVADARREVAELTQTLGQVGEFHQQRLDDLRAEFQRQIRVRDTQIERMIAAAKTCECWSKPDHTATGTPLDRDVQGPTGPGEQ